jgi:predicted dehydrogenase
MMRFADGSVAQFDCGFAGPFRAEMEVIGREAALKIVRPFRTDERSQLLLTAGDVTEHLPFPPEEPFAGEIADMERLALDDRAQRIPLSESRRTAEVITALYRSAREGHTVSLRARP